MTDEELRAERQEWRRFIVNAVRDRFVDPQNLDLIVEVIIEQDQAKAMLRGKGYGCTGMGLLRTAKRVPHADHL